MSAISLSGNDWAATEDETPPLKVAEAYGGQLISSAEDSPARTSPSPGSDEASLASDPPSSSSSPGSPMSLFGPEDGFWSRTSRDSSPDVPASDAKSAGSFYDSIAEAGVLLGEMPDEILASYVSTWALLTTTPWMAPWRGVPVGPTLLESVQAAARVAVATRPGASSPPTTEPSSRWSALSSVKSGFTTSPGECWIAVTSECPSGGGAFSSLPDVLEADVPPRFSLSPKAAAGILRRAKSRGRALPQLLHEALAALAGRESGQRKPPEDTSSAPTSPPPSPEDRPSPVSATQDDDKRTMGTSSPIPPEPPMAISENQRAELRETTYSPQLTTDGGKPGQGFPTIRDQGAVRRLTPTECERLQGFPEGWTWVP
jgi:hypothetical protein